MGVHLFHLFLFGPFLVGTLASGFTRSVGNMIVWGIFALLPLTLVMVLANSFWGTDWQNVLSALGMWGVALALHVAVSAFCRYAFLAEKSDS